MVLAHTAASGAIPPASSGDSHREPGRCSITRSNATGHPTWVASSCPVLAAKVPLELDQYDENVQSDSTEHLAGSYAAGSRGALWIAVGYIRTKLNGL